jgi:DNA (cytosine-5)-methyltransferase 1
MTSCADPTPADFIVKAEEYGVPQARHRVIIVGVRKDVFGSAGGVKKLAPAKPPTVPAK